MVMTGEFMTAFLSVLAVNIPIYLVWLVMFIVALINIKNYPKVSLLTIISVIIFFISNILSCISTGILPMVYREYGWSSSTFAMIMGTVNVIRSFFTALAYALLIGAVFGWRKKDEYLIAEDRQKN